MKDVIFRNATRNEFDIAVSWAAAEGWNPGLDDADIFWETDPEGFVVAEKEGEIVGTGSIVSYGGFGFMGFFIVKKELRGQGIGTRFWNWRKEVLRKRLGPGAVIGMDGVLDMQHFYARGGFSFQHRNLRMEGVGHSSQPAENLSELSMVPYEMVAAVDKCCFGFDRERFLKRWIAPKHGLAIGAFDGEHLLGYGVVRECARGYKIGPLFAQTSKAAESIFLALSDRAAGEPIFLDIPENNFAALAIAYKYGMKKVFACARMHDGLAPKLPWDNVYGVTTFELG